MLHRFELIASPTNAGTDSAALASFQQLFDQAVAADPIMVYQLDPTSYTFVYAPAVTTEDTTHALNRHVFIASWFNTWMGGVGATLTQYAASVQIDGADFYLYPVGLVETRSDNTTAVTFSAMVRS